MNGGWYWGVGGLYLSLANCPEFIIFFPFLRSHLENPVISSTESFDKVVIIMIAVIVVIVIVIACVVVKFIILRQKPVYSPVTVSCVCVCVCVRNAFKITLIPYQ